MNKIIAFSLLIGLTFISCDYYDNFFNKNMNRVDFTSIDEYPLFPSCDSLATADIKQQCFEETLVAFLQKDLEQNEFISTKNTTDAIIIHIEIDKQGKTFFKHIEKATNTQENLPDLEIKIRESIEQLPSLSPAKKRGHYVKSTFMIPLYINNE